MRIHVGKTWHLLRETRKYLGGQRERGRFGGFNLEPIVNLEKAKELKPFFRGEYVVVLQNGTTLKLSRGFRDNLEARLGRTF